MSTEPVRTRTHAPLAAAPRLPKTPAHMPLPHPAMRALRLSIVFVWLWTAFVSMWEFHGTSADLLAAIDAYPAWIKASLIASGALTDLLLGLWLWRRPSCTAYAWAGALMVVMTALATLLSPELWLHPLGPLSKNLPIAAALWVLWQDAKNTMGADLTPSKE